VADPHSRHRPDMDTEFNLTSNSPFSTLVGIETMKEKKDSLRTKNKVFSFKCDSLHSLPCPEQIKSYLDQYVVGQDSAKETLSVAAYNHYKRVLAASENLSKCGMPADLADVELDKSNVLLIGGTGTGKTLMLKTLAKMLGVPFFMADATRLTESGYVGDDVESILTGALRKYSYDVKAVEKAIICIDEIDKIACRGTGTSLTRDVGGEGVQQALLKIIEGSVVGVPPNGGRKHPEQPLIYVDTSNILFVAMGAFPGIHDMVRKRTAHSSVGYGAQCDSRSSDDLIREVTPADLKEFGLISEFIGRFPVIASTNSLGEGDLIRILKEPRNNVVMQYRKLLAMDRVSLEFTDDALIQIARICLRLETGARGLRSIVEKVLGKVMFQCAEMRGNTFVVDGDYVCSSYYGSRAV